MDELVKEIEALKARVADLESKLVGTVMANAAPASGEDPAVTLRRNQHIDAVLSKWFANEAPAPVANING